MSTYVLVLDHEGSEPFELPGNGLRLRFEPIFYNQVERMPKVPFVAIAVD